MLKVERLQLSVQTLTGSTILLGVTVFDTIHSIKDSITVALGSIFTHVTDFNLFYLEEQLEGGRTLLSYPDIQNGSTLKMVSTVAAVDIPVPNLDCFW